MGTTIKLVAFWVTTSFSSETSQRFGGTYRLHLRGLTVIQKETSRSRQHAELLFNTTRHGPSRKHCLLRVYCWGSHVIVTQSVHWRAGCCLPTAVVSCLFRGICLAIALYVTVCFCLPFLLFLYCSIPSSPTSSPLLPSLQCPILYNCRLMLS
jgi:hypothetical protein